MHFRRVFEKESELNESKPLSDIHRTYIASLRNATALDETRDTSVAVKWPLHSALVVICCIFLRVILYFLVSAV